MTDPELLALLKDDVPFGDLTTDWLGIGDIMGSLVFSPRQSGVLAGAAAAGRLFELLGVKVISVRSDGERIAPGSSVLAVRGAAQGLHKGLKVALSLMEHLSGIASRTAELVSAARRGDPDCPVFATRKHHPGVKSSAIEAAAAGGARPHRLGLSETILVFDQHKAFFPSETELTAWIRNHRRAVCGKKIIVEVSSDREARAYMEAGVDGLQFDKVPCAELARIVTALRREWPSAVLIAAGGITPENAAEYARCGVDGLASSWMYNGPPLDMGAKAESGDAVQE